MKKIIKHNWKYIFIFIFTLFSLFISYNIFKGDSNVNYGFSYALSIGEIPYNDFNLIIPLFSPFLYSIGMIFSKSLVVLYFEQAVLLTFMFKILFDILDKKAWIFFTILFFPFPI